MTQLPDKADKLCVTLVGYHGRNNLGDDIFRDVVIRRLNQRQTVGKCFVLCAGTDVFPSYEIGSIRVIPISNPVKFFARFKWLQLLYYGTQSDLIVFAAGSIFTKQDFGLIRFMLKSIRRLNRRSIRYIALGVSVGPFPNDVKRRQCDRLLRQFDDVLLRDRTSKTRLNATMTFGKHQMGYDLGLLVTNHIASPNIPLGRVDIGISLTTRAFPNPETNPELGVLIKAIKQLLDENSQFHLLAFSACSDTIDGDSILTMQFAQQLSNYGDRVIVYNHLDNRLQYSIDILANCKAIIAARMHVGIVALMNAIPTLQICYEPKVKGFYEHHGLDETYLLDIKDYRVEDVDSFLSDVKSGKASRIALQQQICLDNCALAVAEVMGNILNPYLIAKN